MPSSLPQTPEETIAFLKHHQVLEQGHFVLASGRHSPFYIQKSRLIQYPRLLQDMIEARLQRLQSLSPIDVILSPAVGGIPVGQQVALALDTKAVYAERSPENQLVLKRGFRIQPNDRVIMVEDVITTGGTLVELRDFVTQAGATLVGIFTVVNRSGKQDWQGFPLISCIDIDLPTYAPDELPDELAAIPVVRPGTKKV